MNEHPESSYRGNGATESRTADEVQEEIAQTRADLDETLGAIGKRLSPQEIKERAVERARDTASSVAEAVEQVPWRITLAGAAVIAVALVARRRRRRSVRHAEQLRDVLEHVWRQRLEAVRTAPHDGLPRARAALVHAFDRASERAGELASDARERIAHGVGSVAARAQDYAESDTARQVVDPAKRLVESIEEGSRERPLLALGAAAAFGAIVSRMLRR